MKTRHLIALAILLVCVTMAFTQIFKTSLTLTVRDELGNTVDSASVKLFEKKEDYLKEINVAAEAKTNKKGIAKFKGIKPIPYFVLVKKGDKSNSGGGEEVGKLEEGKFNKSTVVIQ
jgi:hypothetical protein